MKKLVSKKSMIFYSLIILFLGIFIYFGVYIKQFLDSDGLSFTVGSLRFTAYSILITIIALVILIITSLWVLKYSEQKIRKISRLKPSNREILVKTLYVTISTIVFLVTLGIVGVDTTALTVFSGTIGIGIGFGLQKIAANFITGIILLFEKSFEIGDLIELNDKTIGFVSQIGGRYILIKTFCGKEMMVPNEEFINYKIINWTHRDTNLRLEVKIEVSHKEDIDKVKNIILNTAKKSIYCLKDPTPLCILQDIHDGIITFLLLFWIEDVKKGFFIPQSEIKTEIWMELQKNRINVPVPIRKIITYSDVIK